MGVIIHFGRGVGKREKIGTGRTGIFDVDENENCGRVWIALIGPDYLRD
jgi:hypothetical protein